MNWNILVIEGKEIKRDLESNGEWNPKSQNITASSEANKHNV